MEKCSATRTVTICERALDYFLTHADAIGEELTWQMGRPIGYTPNEIRRGFQERARYMIQAAIGALSDVPVSEKEGFQRFIRREALGTVFVVAPWNYPYLTSVNVVIPALLAGNTVILKHAQQTPLCAERYAARLKRRVYPKVFFNISTPPTITWPG